MQYYIKFYNTKTGELVGYYKEGSGSCVSKIPNGMKWFNDKKRAIEIMISVDDGFIRDKDKHYYKGQAIIYGDHSKQSNKEKTQKEKEEELKNVLNALIRKNNNKNR